jgi:non-ribosomal peptide synthetase component F
LVATGNDIEEAGRTLASRLKDGGPVAVDWLADPAQRVAMIRNTIEASTSLLDGGAADRLAEIAVFAEDEEVPVADVTQLWRATAGLTQLASEQVIAKLASLDLIAVNNRQPRTITMHDVIRDYLRADLVS